MLHRLFVSCCLSVVWCLVSWVVVSLLFVVVVGMYMYIAIREDGETEIREYRRKDGSGCGCGCGEWYCKTKRRTEEHH
jgi:hypothetical protein